MAGPHAMLPSLGRVDAVQPDPLPVNLDGVAVDHRRLAGPFGDGDGWYRRWIPAGSPAESRWCGLALSGPGNPPQHHAGAV